MRPRTIAQRHVLALSQKLPKITTEQEEYAFRHAVAHEAYRLKSGRTGCLDCGHVWHEPMELVSIIEIECPNCGIPLKVENTKRLKTRNRGLFGIVTTSEEYQVIRLFEIYTHHRIGEPKRNYIHEVAQLWMHPDKKLEIVGQNRGGMGGCDTFHWGFEIRNRDNLYKYNFCPTAMWPKAQVLPIYKRNGAGNNFHGIAPYNLLTGIMRDPVMETLIKAKQYSLLNAREQQDHRVSRYWSSIKICMRNRYVVKDAKSWLDYLDLLERYGKDLRNAKFVCPANFRREHDRYVARRREELKAKEAVDIAKANQAYIERCKPYLSLCFIDGDLRITVLQNVEEFKLEGDLHNHCVYANSYYSRKDSLIMSAQVKGKRTETIQMSLTTLKVTQSRGKDNLATKFHSRILALIERSLPQIRKAMAKNKKKKTQQAKADSTQSCAA